MDHKTHLLEVIAELDHWDGIKDPRRVEDKMSMFQRIDVTLD